MVEITDELVKNWQKPLDGALPSAQNTEPSIIHCLCIPTVSLLQALISIQRNLFPFR